MADTQLPIAALRTELLAELGKRPVVITSPTGSGKSTQVPRYCPGPTLVIEPRRVACRALAARVAELEGCEVGTTVGYQVRDESVRSGDTRVLFVTPGIALRMSEQWPRFAHIVIDEFHERAMDIDLLFALLRARHPERMVVMSATMDAERVAGALGGVHLRAKGRAYPVDIEYLPQQMLLPEAQGLEERVEAALRRAESLAGDVLVFLPGKGEIGAVESHLARKLPKLSLLPLHGGLTLQQQSRIFQPSGRARRVILSTNVAETSLTVPGIGVVIDAGLVRRTRYHQGRGYLALMPIALDSADQRAGRAGRLGPGHCIRLWSSAAKLEAATPPEIHRESLTPLLLAAAACGSRVDDLPFLDLPKTHALQDARADLRALGAVDEDDDVTEAGRALFGLPLDPALGRLLVQARGSDAAEDVVNLVAALAVGRPMFIRPVDPERPDPLREDGCDASALIRAMRLGDPREHPISAAVLGEARRNRDRIRRLLGAGGGKGGGKGNGGERNKAAGTGRSRDMQVDRARLAAIAMAADPRCAHVARERRGRLSFSNGGTELELGRDSCLGVSRAPEAILVLDARGVGDRRRTRMLITCACPVPLSALDAAGLGRDRLAGVAKRGGKLRATLERVYAKRVLSTREVSPKGEMARDGIAKLFLEGRLLPDALAAARARLSHLKLAQRLSRRRPRPQLDWSALPAETPALDDWVAERLLQLGVESGEDLGLLSAQDLIPDALPYDIQQHLDEQFPMTLDMGDARYVAEYDLERGRVLLTLKRGKPAQPPRRNFLPAFGGLSVFAEAGGRMHRVT